jgi:hypothetical protein
VFTVAVVLGAGASEVFTLPPDCALRPERGSCTACVPWDDPAGGPNCAKAGEEINSAAASAQKERSEPLPSRIEFKNRVAKDRASIFPCIRFP